MNADDTVSVSGAPNTDDITCLSASGIFAVVEATDDNILNGL